MTPEERNAVIEECAEFLRTYGQAYLSKMIIQSLKTASPQPSTAESVGQGDAVDQPTDDQLRRAVCAWFGIGTSSDVAPVYVDCMRQAIAALREQAGDPR